jgi:hypothetical protein
MAAVIAIGPPFLSLARRLTSRVPLARWACGDVRVWSGRFQEQRRDQVGFGGE